MGKTKTNDNIDTYLIDGCGRCSLYKTPDCKVRTWNDEIKMLREIVLESCLKEEYKWSQPCYTWKGKNVLMVSALKDCALLSFFKGSLLKDPHKLLVSPGKNSQADRQFRYTDCESIREQKDIIISYIEEAIALEKAGKKVSFKKERDPLPDELILKFEQDPTLKKAFEALTPGRQRGYIIHFSQAKKSETRKARIEKYAAKIMEGKGYFE